MTIKTKSSKTGKSKQGGIEDRQKSNESLKCSVKECQANRNGFSKFCTKHKLAHYKYGSSEGFTVREISFFEDKSIVARYVNYLDAMEDKKLQKILNWFKDWIEQSQNSKKKEEKYPFVSLLDGSDNEKLKQILIDIAGLCSYHKSKLKKSMPEEVLYFNIGLRIAKLSGQYDSSSNSQGKIMRQIGKYFMNNDMKNFLLKCHKYKTSFLYKESKKDGFNILHGLRIYA